MAASAGQHDEQLEALRAELRDIKAKAYIEGKPANTKSLDAKIETVAEQAKAAQEMADAARDANAIIERGIALQEAELESLSAQLRAAIRTEIIARHDEAAEKYAAAITELGAIVAQMTAAERAWRHVVVNIMDTDGNGAQFPRRGLRVLEDIRDKGVRVPASASRLADPKIAAEYGDSYDRFWYLPKWADPRTLGFGDSHVADIVDGLRKAGVETHAFVGYVPPTPEPQLKVRVLRGVITGEPQVHRDPATDKVISADVVEWKVGDDVMLDESQARALQRARMVAIHGEDEMPMPRPAGGPVEIDASLPKEERRHGWTPKPRGEYSGHHFPLDLSAYGD
ncbi:hypothetical protein [Caballeronia grimmiae]|uniref:hypothetical protein n=1 Tax=Caballeronia grimmiae TaxID=1071679 RepID=UPI0038B98743